MNTGSSSFAAQYADPAMGFNVVPRWFRVSPFWQGLKLEHRAILDELFHMVRRLPDKWKGQIDVGRGQFVMTQSAVAERCGASREQVRAVLDKAEGVGILSFRLLTWSDKGKTHPITLATWHDFETYDRPQDQKNQTKTQATNQTSNQAKTQAKNHNNTEGETQVVQTESSNTEERDCAAAPLGASGPGRPVGGVSQAGGVQEGSVTTPASKGTGPLAAEGKTTTPAWTRPAAAPKQKSAAKKSVTPEDVALICTDYASMLRYLLHGAHAVHDRSGQYGPGPLNWEQHRKGEKDLGVGDWGAQPFMGYYWSQVCLYRVQRKINLSLPPWDKLGGHFRNLLNQMPKQQLYSVITFVVYYFDVIRWMLRRAGNTVFLDENSLVNPLVRQSANNLMAMSEPERAVLIEQFQSETGCGRQAA